MDNRLYLHTLDCFFARTQRFKKIISRSAFVLMSLLTAQVTVADPQQAVNPQYRVNTGDTIQINVFGQPDLNVVAQLPDNGVVNYPFLGELRLANKTVANIEETIYDGLLGDYLVNPSVQVNIVEYRPFFISGAVNKPGGYPFQPGITIAKAAALAGGFTERAATKSFRVERAIGERTIDVVLGPVDAIQPGDIVTVKQSFF
ncbi:polysaccharide biosynthesis/export family protein [Alteromonas oceanisediminis]|uniref:polysaccharide biosynthesis/export family protein n=1 Tax=Alteromonas oceanisediminis TaxID=2836180 RepID=UPI001BDB361F|nr:polysaccharide biosynthesis/export family protein [Alteromonas oceanisediminis]MBT0587619.1 polysaccharide export protein [Alteromonas oceanisediminis]